MAVSGPSKPPLSVTKIYKAYFAPAEVLELVQAQAVGLPYAQIEAIRQQACGFIDRVGGRLGFPRRTIATAQVLYHRFHLFFQLCSFRYQDVAVAALLASAKLEDTLKKLNEVQLAAHHVRCHLDGTPNLPPNLPRLEEERNSLLGIERLILETISFNFNLHAGSAAFGVLGAPDVGRAGGAGCDVFSYVFKIGKTLNVDRELIRLAFRLAIDAHRSLVPLSYPSHVIATACLYLASLFSPEYATPATFAAGWERKFACEMDDLDDICHAILDLLLTLSVSGTQSIAASASLPVPNVASLFDPASHTSATPVDLTQIKISLRQRATLATNGHAAKRRRTGATAGNGTPSMAVASALAETDDVLGRNDVSVRFLWTADAATSK